MLAFITFASPWVLAAALLLVAAAGAAAYLRRPDAPRATQYLAGGGLLLLALAAGGLTWLRPSARQVAVMVDLSASTRGAGYRDPKALTRRIEQLLGDVPYRIVYFASDNRPAVPAASPLADLPGEQTVFAPPQAPAILLFSDCRFDPPPVCPPTFIVADAALQQPADAAVRNLELRDGQVLATLSNTAPAERELRFSNATSRPVRAQTGETVATTRASDTPGTITAQLSAGDLWPENDRLTISVLPPAKSERWWVGRANPAGWRRFDAGSLPLESSVYLAPAVIVLENLPASALSAEHQRLLHQYVRDLGGALMILGGDHAFAAGGYPGTKLESISPLTSLPPTPGTHWIVLADASGSMATAAGASTRWDLEKQAIAGLLPQLPPDDPVSVGSFAKELVWWSTRKSARETANLRLPPETISPRGPTDLEPALTNLIESADASIQNELLLLTDAETEIKSSAALRQGMTQKKIRLHILAIGRGKALAELTQLATATGGRVIEELDAAQWPAAAKRLAQAAVPNHLSSVPILVHYTQWKGMTGHPAAPWNRTWQREKRTDTWADAMLGQETIPLMAQWQVGQGTVLAAAFTPGVSEVEQIAGKIAQQPRDDRFRIAWRCDAQVHVTVDASADNKLLNGEKLRLDLIDPAQIPADAEQSTASSMLPIPQTAPGRYELTMPAPDHPLFAAVRVEQKEWNNRTVWKLADRFAIPGRYPREFNAIGNDPAAMRDLAQRSGGAVIDPSDTTRLKLPWPRQDVPLSTAAALAGAALLAAGLAWWRWT